VITSILVFSADSASKELEFGYVFPGAHNGLLILIFCRCKDHTASAYSKCGGTSDTYSSDTKS